MINPLRILGIIFHDPYRKAFAVLVAVVVWVLMFNQIIRSRPFSLHVVPIESVPSNPQRRQLYIIEPGLWRLVEINGIALDGRRIPPIEVQVEAPNEVLADFGPDPSASIDPGDLEARRSAGSDEEILDVDPADPKLFRWEIATDRETVKTTLVQGGPLRLRFRRFKRHAYEIDVARLPVLGYQRQQLEWNRGDSRVDPPRLEIELPARDEPPSIQELLEPIQLDYYTRHYNRRLAMKSEWARRGYTLIGGSQTPLAELVFDDLQTMEPPRVIEVRLKPPMKIRPFFMGIDWKEQTGLLPRIGLEPAQVEMIRLHLSADVDQTQVRERVHELTAKYLYFTADLTRIIERTQDGYLQPPEGGQPYKLIANSVPVEAHVDDSFVDWRELGFRANVTIVPEMTQVSCYID